MAEVYPEATVDPKAALAELGYEATSEPIRITGGWDTLIWRFSTEDGARHSLRVYFLPDGDEVAHRECLALDACQKAAFPAPRVERVARHSGLPVAVLSWCPGRPVLSDIEKKPWTLWRLSRLFGRTQARLHAIPLSPGFTTGSPATCPSRLPAEFAHLAENAASVGPRADRLIHMDYHPLNVLSNGTDITGVVDWGGAAAGDRRADLARTYVTLATAPVPPGPLKPVLTSLRTVMIRAWQSGYEEAAGRMPDYSPLRAWAAATLLREVQRVIHHEGVWATEAYIAELHRRIVRWARESRIAAAS